MVENLIELEKCYYNSIGIDFEPLTYQRKYKQTLFTLKSCLKDGTQCDFVCQEFKLGTTGNLFIGDLSFYQKIIERIENLLLTFRKHNSEFNDYKEEIMSEEFNFDNSPEEKNFFIEDTSAMDFYEI